MAVLGQEVLVGNIGSIFEKRVVGKDSLSVIDFTVAVSSRKKVGDKWVDGNTYWANCTAWGRLADNIAESFNKGDRVMVIGKIEMKDAWTNKEGEEMPARPYIRVDFAGLEVSFNPAESKRTNGGGSNNSSAPQFSSEEKPKQKKAAAKKVEVEEPVEDDDFDLDFSEFDDLDVDDPF